MKYSYKIISLGSDEIFANFQRGKTFIIKQSAQKRQLTSIYNHYIKSIKKKKQRKNNL